MKKHIGLKRWQMFTISYTNIWALRASYKIALQVAKTNRLYTIDIKSRTLVKDWIKDIWFKPFDEYKQKTALVPLFLGVT